MKSKLLSLLGVGLLAGPVVANAGFLYQFSFDAVDSYDAAAFEFVTTSLLLNVGDSAAVSPPGDLNGYAVTQTTVNQRFGTVISFTPDGGFFGSTVGTSAGDVIFYFFGLGNYTGGVGTFSTTLAGRNISLGSGGSYYLYTTGALTISDLAVPVPEPATLALLGLGLVGLALSRRRKAA